MSVFDDALKTFADWRPYTNKATGKSGWISAGGLVRYTDPRGKEEETKGKRADAQMAIGNAIAAPEKITDEHIPQLYQHLSTLTKPQLQEFVKQLKGKISQPKASLAQRIVEHVQAKRKKPPESDKKPAQPEPAPVTDQSPEKTLDLTSTNPNHPFAKMLAADPHVNRVFNELSKDIERHRESINKLDESAKAEKLSLGRMVVLDKELEKLAGPAMSGIPGIGKLLGGGKAEEDRKVKRAELQKERDKAEVDYKKHRSDRAEYEIDLVFPSAAFRENLMQALEKKEGKVDIKSSFEPLSTQPHIDYAPMAKTPEAVESLKMAEGYAAALADHVGDIPISYGVSIRKRGWALSPKDSGLTQHTICLSYQPDDKHDSEAIRVGVHEIGHAIEDLKPGLQAKAHEFLDYRCGDEVAVSLNKIPQLRKMGYDDKEKGRKDQFDKAFELNHAYYIGKPYDTGATEVISVGLEKLYTDPIRLFTKDPEYAAFLIHALRYKPEEKG